MALLGEIVKTTQALQYHAKSAQIAGKNLTHINDENYARQRVVSRDGSMYREVGSLSTSALEMGGLDHARSEMLDRRVITEVGESASLEARKEILDLLQAALGERVTRQGINAALDDQSESDLAPGSLTRALNDFFNTFDELSAAPDEIAIRQQLYHKVHTLNKRFNEAGERFEEIEAELTVTASTAVTQVNSILKKLHEVNKQIRRFELQGKGKAVTYRDRRQQLLENLSKLMDVKLEDDFEVDPLTKKKKASGFINLFTTGAKGEKIKLLGPKGAKTLSMDWGQEFALSAPDETGGTAARVRAKVGVDGKLGRVEVLAGGSQYSDKDGPIIVAFAPPKRTEVATVGGDQAQAAVVDGGVIADPTLQSGLVVARDPALSDAPGTVADIVVPPNRPDDKSDVGSGYASGDVPTVTITGDDKGTLAGTAKVNLNGKLDIVFSGIPSGTGALTVEVSSGVVFRNPADLFGQGGDFVQGSIPEVIFNGVDTGSLKGTATVNPDGSVDIAFSGKVDGTGTLTLKVEGPTPLELPIQGTKGSTTAFTVNGQVALGDVASGPPAPFGYDAGEVFHYHGEDYYQALVDTFKGDSLADPEKFLKLSSIPQGESVRDFAKRFAVVESYDQGTQFYDEGKLYQAVGGISPVVEEKGENKDADGKVVSSQAYVEGDVFRYKDVYYLVRPEQSFNPKEISYFAKGEIVLEDLEGKDQEKRVKGDTQFGVSGTAEKLNDRILVLGKELPRRDLNKAPDAKAGAQSVVKEIQNLQIVNETLDKGTYLYDQDLNKYFLTTEKFDHTNKNPVVPSTMSPAVVEVTTFLSNASSVKAANKSSYKEGEIIFDDSSKEAVKPHYYVTRSFDLSVEQLPGFNPSDSRWDIYLRKFDPKLAENDSTAVVRRASPINFDPKHGQAVELNLGLAEAVVRKGEIVGFNILDEGKGYPSTNALFLDGVELSLESGSIHGYQRVHQEEMESFRQHLNGLAGDFVTKVNQVYNPEDEPGGYLFSFDAYLGRPAQGSNEMMEDLGVVGEEGDGRFTLYRDEVEMTVPYPENDTFTLVVTDQIFPDNPLFDPEQFVTRSSGAQLPPVHAYAGARRMKHVTVENDFDFRGEDGIPNTDDDGRSILIGYEDIPYRWEQGDKAFVLGDNFHFDVVPANAWNIAKSMRVDKDFTVESIKSTAESEDGANEIALAIAELGNGAFTDQVSSMNTTIGNVLSDVGDNLDHQKAVERLLLDERQAISSVSIDEEVADLMRYQRSYQASAKVLTTLDKMLELIVTGLIR